MNSHYRLPIHQQSGFLPQSTGEPTQSYVTHSRFIPAAMLHKTLKKSPEQHADPSANAHNHLKNKIEGFSP